MFADIGRAAAEAAGFSWHSFRLLLLGVTGISANFVLIAQGLHYISPTTTQVLWQISPFTMIVVGVLVFKDRMTAAQKSVWFCCLSVCLCF
ncbi:putative transporter [Neisseria gonorrhoeae]|uniref:Putative transporter n=1 Tax=Neisseria gonorrhoeae TaxID=485 RepID=A0A378VXS1_NEIGO|nr:putative transporter [Neisseria gonorrhoeae]